MVMFSSPTVKSMLDRGMEAGPDAALYTFYPYKDTLSLLLLSLYYKGAYWGAER